MKATGICYLVGAGPGDPGLITVKGRECLRRAQVVYRDCLACEELLAELAPGAQVFYVGKQAGSHAVPQERIQELLCEQVRAGRVVVRLKGGDPFVFGRGGEEALALRRAGLPFEVVPGVTAGVAAPAYAGIPVTQRALATSVTFVTGHETPDKEEGQIDWRSLAAGNQTLVFYMGVGNLPLIVQRLQEHGRSAGEPVALVRWGTTPEHFTLTGTLANIVERARRARLRPPALIVVGPVVALREELAWFEKRPLHGRTVVVTRSRAQMSDLAASLAGLGARVLAVPTIRIEAVDADASPGGGSALAQALQHLAAGGYDWVVFTSVNGVEHVWERLRRLGRDARAFAGCRIAGVGAKTAAALAARGLWADLVPERFTAAALLTELRARLGAELAGARFLLLRGDQAGRELPTGLRAAGAAVDEPVVYRNLPVDELPAGFRRRLLAGGVQALTFASASTARNFCRLLGEEDLAAVLALPARPLCVSIGPATSAAMRASGLPVDAQAREHTISGLAAAVAQLFGEGRPVTP